MGRTTSANYKQHLVDEFFPEAFCYKPMKIANFPNSKGITLEALACSDEYFCQEKIDGFWYTFERTEHYTYLFGRRESTKNDLPAEKSANVPHIARRLSLLPKDTIVIGEIYTGNKRDTSKDVASFMGCLPEKAIARQEERGYVHYLIHDIIRLNGEDLTDKGALERYEILAKLFKKLNLADGYIELAKNLENKNHMIDFEKVIAEGGEGIVLKNKRAKYLYDKRPAYSSVKIKKSITVDVICMGFEDPTKLYEGKEESKYYVIEKRVPLELVSKEWTGIVKKGGREPAPSSVWVEDYRQEGAPDIEDSTRVRVIEVTKAYFYNWKNAIKIGVYKDGELISIGTVSSGLTDLQKAEFSETPDKYIGQVMECGAMEIGDEALRHPVLIRFRDDKNPTECTWKSIFKS